MKEAHRLYQAGETFAEAQKIAWKKAEAKQSKEVTFYHKGNKANTTRRIASLSSVGYKRSDKPAKKPQTLAKMSTIKVVDLDKFEATGNIFKSIISFNYKQVVSFAA